MSGGHVSVVKSCTLYISYNLPEKLVQRVEDQKNKADLFRYRLSGVVIQSLLGQCNGSYFKVCIILNKLY